MVRDQIRDKLPYPFEDLGEQSVKNIVRPVRVYRVGVGAPIMLTRAQPRRLSSLRHRHRRFDLHPLIRKPSVTGR
jgi:hypothetical protein